MSAEENVQDSSHKESAPSEHDAAGDAVVLNEAPRESATLDSDPAAEVEQSHESRTTENSNTLQDIGPGITIVDDTVLDTALSERSAASSPSPENVPRPSEKTLSEVSPSAAPVQPSQNAPSLAGLPAGVDLQALLKSFSDQTPVVVTPIISQSPADSIAHESAGNVVKSSMPSQDVSEAPKDNAVYEQFLVDERRIMGHTAPHEFEPGSRLFVGNVTSERVPKRELFFLFHKYGKLAQIALKSTFGFVQFLTAQECHRALEGEQGVEIGGRKLHLEVSKPQIPRGAPTGTNTGRRRSRSPVRSRGAHGARRESYDFYGREPQYDQRDRSPPSRYDRISKDSFRRSPSPRRPPMEAPLLPPRFGTAVPDFQIVVTDEADRNYIQWVESSIRQAGHSCETLFLSPRLPFLDVVRQMVQEGVLAVIVCNRHLQMANKVNLQVFDRSRGSANVRFDEYQGLDVPTAVQLLNQTRTRAPPSSVPAPGQPNLAAMISRMDPATLAAMINQIKGS